MQITTSAITNGEFADKYGKRGSQFSENIMPTFSIPFEISSAPERVHSLLPWCWKTDLSHLPILFRQQAALFQIPHQGGGGAGERDD